MPVYIQCWASIKVRELILEKIGSRRMEDFPPTTLYLDDLSEIVGIFTKACKCIEIKAGDYKITDPAELEALATKFPNGRFESIYLQGYEPYISLDLRTFGVTAYISDDTLEQRGVVAKVRDILNKGKKKSPRLLFYALTYIAAFVGTWQIISKDYLLGLPLIGLSLVSISVSVNYGMKNKVVVHSHLRGTAKTFFERKKDDIALAVISAFLGALLGGVITYLLRK